MRKTRHLVRHHDLSIEEAIREVWAIRPIAMDAPGYGATARRSAELELERRES
jgi:hypothetical protein